MACCSVVMSVFSLWLADLVRPPPPPSGALAAAAVLTSSWSLLSGAPEGARRLRVAAVVASLTALWFSFSAR